jgi:hypothetical protein
MADHSTRFSEVVAHLSAAEEAWIRAQLDAAAIKDETRRAALAWQPEDDVLAFNWEVHDDPSAGDESWGRHLWLYAAESGSPLEASRFVRAFLKQFRPDQCFHLTWAETCSRLRVGEFGGGAVFVTADGVEAYRPNEWLQERERRFRDVRPAVRRLLARAEQRGLDPADLDELVHDALAQRAAAVNNGGLEDQIALLVEDLGAEELERRLAELAGSRREGSSRS